MATAENAKLQVEQGQTLVAYAALTDSGDHQYFTPAAAVLSNKSGFEPSVIPNGVATSLNMVTPGAANDTVAVAAFTAYVAGVLYSVSADAALAITRPASAVAKINSITMTDAGVLAEVAGTDAADAVLIETRGGAGGPPLVPVDSVEIAQIRMVSSTAAIITAAEIVQVVGQHCERSDYPTLEVDTLGQGSAATVAATRTAHVKFSQVLPASHTGPIAKKTYSKHYTPVFADISKSKDFKAIEKTHSVSSSEGYGYTTASTSSALGQGGFTAELIDGVSDNLVQQKNQLLTFKFFPDRNKAAYTLTQGKLGISRTWPVGDQNNAACTISGDPTAEFTS